METVITAIQKTPIPTILILGGLLFILLAFVTKLGGFIEVSNEQKKLAIPIGLLVLTVGLVLTFIPPSNSNTSSKPIDNQSTDYANDEGKTNVVPERLQLEKPNLRQKDSANSTWIHVNVGDLILNYDSQSGAANVETNSDSGEKVIIKKYPPGEAGSFSANWTHILNTPKGILYYNSATGSSVLGHLDSSGTHTTIKTYPNNFPFISGWTSITSTPEGILFVNDQTNARVLTKMDNNGNILPK